MSTARRHEGSGVGSVGRDCQDEEEGFMRRVLVGVTDSKEGK